VGGGAHIPEDQIGSRDHFFELGGTSLSALRLAIALDRAVSFKDLIDHPTLADLATLLDNRSSSSSPASQLNMEERSSPYL